MATAFRLAVDADISDRISLLLQVLLHGIVPFVELLAWGYKQSAIACVPKFYWTGSLHSSSIEVVPGTSTSPKRVAGITGSIECLMGTEGVSDEVGEVTW